MSYSIGMKLWETRVLSDKTNYTGTDLQKFAIISGSRAIFTISVTSIDVGASLSVGITNGFGEADPFISLDTITVNAIGQTQRVYADFNCLFNLAINVTGGDATYKVVVTLNDNSGTTKIENAQLNVNLDAIPDEAGHHDSVRIGSPQGFEMAVNSDGSINTRFSDDPNEAVMSIFTQSDPIVAGAESTIQTITINPGHKAWLNRIEVSGENIGVYTLYLNNVQFGRRHTWFGGGLNEDFEFSTNAKKGFPLQPGDVLEVRIQHDRPASGVFESRCQLIMTS